MEELLKHDTNLWVTFSFIIFALIAFKLGRKSIVGMLDKRITEIRKEIDAAESLRVEAQELLAQYQRKQRDAEKEAQIIIENAQEHAQAILKQAEEELAETMQRREHQLAERLRRLEENAIAEIQDHAADLAISATTEIISKTLDEQTNTELVDQSIKDTSKQLN